MQQSENNGKNKGGRPRKENKKDQLIPVKCSREERTKIQDRARSVNLSVSEYMRKIALTGRIDSRQVVFPNEVLQFTGTVNHIAANLNQIAKKRNGIDELNVMERAELEMRSRELKRLTVEIKGYLK